MGLLIAWVWGIRRDSTLRSRRMWSILRVLRVLRVALTIPIWRRLWRRRLLLAFALDRHAVFDAPKPAFAFLFNLSKCLIRVSQIVAMFTSGIVYLVLSKIMANTALPSIAGSLEFEVRIPPLNSAVNLLEIHNTTLAILNRLINEIDVVGLRPLKLLFCVVFDSHFR